MNRIQALHTAARHYCHAQYSYWYQKSTELRQIKPRDPSSYQQTLLDSYARSNLLMVICTEIERLDSDELDNIENTRDRILHIGRVAQEPPLRPNMGQPSTPQVLRGLTFGINVEDAISTEREAFCTHIQGLSESCLQSVQPLPYQRVLSPAESNTVWRKLRHRWQIIGWRWYPLCQCNLSDITAFDAVAFEEYFSSISLVDMVSLRGVTRIWEMREYGIEYEQDVSLFEPAYNGYEGYWTSDSFDWIVYASHEDSVTVGGWLLNNIKAQWPDWKQHTW